MDIFSLPIVEVGISILISWALFAIFCSMIHETLVQIKSERGRFFKKYVLKQLYDNPNLINWGSLLYNNSAVDLLSREHNKPASEITPKIFSEGLIEVVANAHLVQSSKNSDPAYIAKYQSQLLSDFDYGTKILLPSNVIDFLKNAIAKARIKAGGNGSINEDQLYKYLVDDISDWYGQLCARTSIWYGKTTKMRLFFLGLILSVLLNVNSITLFKYYNDNPNARKALIEYYQKKEAELNALALRNEPMANNPDLEAERKAYSEELQKLIAANKLPVGWESNFFNSPKDYSWGNIFLTVLGYAISAFAASVGAPFWFDLLKKANPIKSKTT